jgi:hypothetical protein
MEIRDEIASIENHQADRQNNHLKNAPQTAARDVNHMELTYSREKRLSHYRNGN